MSAIFVSHIHEEAALARKLKDWLEDAFLGQCQVFVSSDERSISPGDRWLDEIDGALGSASALVVLCSPASIRRPWVNFETGAGWVKGVPVVPVCHSGLRLTELPLPLSAFQALDLENDQFVVSLLSALARHLGFERTPPVDSEMLRDLRSESAISSVSEPEGLAQSPELPPECLEVMVALSEDSEAPTSAALASRFGVNEEKMRYFLDVLRERDLINFHLYTNSAATYFLTRSGRRLLVEQGRL